MRCTKKLHMGRPAVLHRGCHGSDALAGLIVASNHETTATRTPMRALKLLRVHACRASVTARAPVAVLALPVPAIANVAIAAASLGILQAHLCILWSLCSVPTCPRPSSGWT